VPAAGPTPSKATLDHPGARALHALEQEVLVARQAIERLPKPIDYSSSITPLTSRLANVEAALGQLRRTIESDSASSLARTVAVRADALSDAATRMIDHAKAWRRFALVLGAAIAVLMMVSGAAGWGLRDTFEPTADAIMQRYIANGNRASWLLCSGTGTEPKIENGRRYCYIGIWLEPAAAPP